MPRDKVSDSKGLQWGCLASHCKLPEQSAKALGAGLDIAVRGLNVIELELLAGMVNEVRVNQDRKDGYLGGDRANTLAKFEQYRAADDSAAVARGKAVAPKANHITTAQHLTNADSFAWLFISMLQGRPDTLSIARRFGGIYANLRAACRKFAEVQAAAITPRELAVAGMVTIDEI